MAKGLKILKIYSIVFSLILILTPLLFFISCKKDNVETKKIKLYNTTTKNVETLNLENGITSTIGFHSISSENFVSIIKRLFNNTLPVEINEKCLKSLYLHYLAKNKETNTKLPYELIVWNALLDTIPSLEVLIVLLTLLAESIIVCILAVFCVTEVICPTSPLSAITAISSLTPLFAPTFIIKTLL